MAAVRAAADPGDGRSVLLHITERGRLLLDQDRRRRADQLAAVIDAAEREQLARAIELVHG
jgi:DNA-binding MarR family transcriptional regulator